MREIYGAIHEMKNGLIAEGKERKRENFARGFADIENPSIRDSREIALPESLQFENRYAETIDKAG